MSTNFVEIVNVDFVKPHPNADKLEIAYIRSAPVVIGKGYLKRNDKAVYFPADMLIRYWVADKLGVSKYLKHAMYPGDTDATACRVAACRLRGQSSFGFLTSLEDAAQAAVLPPEVDLTPGFEGIVPFAILVDLDVLKPGDNVDSYFAACKYVPPERTYAGDCIKPHHFFQKYTSIENYHRYPHAFPPGTPVRITEKIHGTNSRVGVLQNPTGEFEYVAGSHNTQKKAPEQGQQGGLYWRPLQRAGVLALLNDLCDEKHNVILFGEIYGVGVQDMDYGTANGEPGYRVFDIWVDGHYCDWHIVEAACKKHGLETAPLLYVGPFETEVLESLTDGPTTLATADQIASPFKGREGIVITALTETYSPVIAGRLILKKVSADYLDRKGAQDNA